MTCGNSTKHSKEEAGSKTTRRTFLTLASSAAALGVMKFAHASEKVPNEGVHADDNTALVKAAGAGQFEIREDYKPFHAGNNVFLGVLRRKPELTERFMSYMGEKFDESKPGYRQLDQALGVAGFSIDEKVTPLSALGVPNTGLNDWKQRRENQKRHPFDMNVIASTKYRFPSKNEAAGAIKRAAKLYGADLVGITQQDERWDYAGFVNPLTKEEYGWERFPFKPKTVIVLAFEMDYEAYSTAPSYVSEAATGNGYSQMAKTSFQLSVFLKKLGYQAVPAGNDLGLSVPYAIAAGLGESSRMGTLVTYPYGPRVRIAKVYTDFSFVEYDKPVSFGVNNFCEHCMRCAQVCPAKAISTDPSPTFEPTYASADKWFNNPGVKKYYNDMLKCFEYWLEGNNSCGVCISCCPYSKPDLWHHRLVRTLTEISPAATHTLLREMDTAFGYGNTFDQEAIAKFWDPKARDYLGY